MSEFRAGDTAIYIGTVKNIYCASCIAHGDEVRLVRYMGNMHFPSQTLRQCWLIDRHDIRGMGIVVPESDLQKPPKHSDEFDIRNQKWYQNIINAPEKEPV